jgi:hypothetical protein
LELGTPLTLLQETTLRNPKVEIMDGKHSFYKVYYRWTGIPKRATIGEFLTLCSESDI